MKFSKTKKLIFWIAGVSLTLIVALIVHIAIVTAPTPDPVHHNLQLARIDFHQQIDSSEATQIQSYIGHLPGVHHVYFNLKAYTLVYSFDLSKQASANVFQKLEAFGHYNAERFIPNGKDLAAGCPVLDHNSFLYRTGAFVRNLF